MSEPGDSGHRAPDHKLVIKAPLKRGGTTYWLNVGTLALWVDREKKQITGECLLNQNPDVRYRVFTDDRGKTQNTTE